MKQFQTKIRIFSVCLLICMLTLSFIPVTAAPQEEQTAFCGIQRSVDTEGVYALRLICISTQDSGNEHGMIIRCSDSKGERWNFTVRSNGTCKEISDVRGNRTTAEELGGACIFTAVVTGIPSDTELFGVEVTPYAADQSGKKYGGSQMAVMKQTEYLPVNPVSLKEQENALKVYGRSVPLEDGIACDYSASGIEFQATLAGKLTLEINCTGTAYYTLYLNGKRQDTRLKFERGRRTYVIAENLAAGTYQVRLVKQSHVKHCLTELYTLGIRGTLLERPADRDLLIEFVGDSITCGYGVTGYPKEGAAGYNTAEFCDATQSYAYRTASMMEADYSLVCVSGWCVMEGKNGSIPSIYGKTCFERNKTEEYHPTRTADVVVVNLGTNDERYLTEKFRTDFAGACTAFIRDIKAKNPHAKVVWLYGNMIEEERLGAFEERILQAVKDAGGETAGVYALKVPYNRDAGDRHPSAKGQMDTARTLVPFLKETVLK